MRAVFEQLMLKLKQRRLLKGNASAYCATTAFTTTADSASDALRSFIEKNPGARVLTWLIGKLEYGLSLQSVLHLQSFLLPLHRVFRAADVVHYHIIHDGYFSLLALPFLTGLFRPRHRGALR